MKPVRLAAVGASCALALALSGCVGFPGADDLADTATDTASRIAQSATDLADSAADLADSASDTAEALASINWSKESTVTVLDAATGESIATVTDQAAIDRAFSGFSGANDLAGSPTADPQYRFEVWQQPTETVLPSSENGDLVKVAEVVTYQGSDVVSLTVSPIGLTLHLSSPDAAQSLRQLAEQQG